MPAAADSPDVLTGAVPPDLPALAADRIAVGRDLGRRYDVTEFIARGGFATVWHAVDRVAGTSVAVKRLDPRTGRGRDFYRELRAMFTLDHPNVVRLVNLQESAGHRYLILEFCGGGNLRSAISRARRDGPRPSPERTVGIVRQVATALAAAHARGLTHRDLKPENVLFAGESPGAGCVKLADFGLAMLLAATADDGVLRGLTGSPAYMAPEQFSGQFNPASDVYALGVIAFELLTNDLPFAGGPEQLAYHHLRTAPDVPAGLPAVWADLLPAMLAKAPADRPTAAAVVDQLTSVTIARPTPPRPMDERPRPIGPTSQIHATSSGFLAVTSSGLVRLNADGEQLGSVDLLDVSAVFPGPSDTVRLTAAGRVLEWSAPSNLVEVGTVPTGLSAYTVFGDNRLIGAGFRGEAIEVHDVRTGRILWSRSVPTGGLKSFVVPVGSDGELAVTDFDGGPGLRFFGPDGDDRGRVVLPGICWQLAPCPGEAACSARLLAPSGFEAYRVDSTGAGRLHGSLGLTALTADAVTGQIIGLWADGSLTAWRDRRDPLDLPPVPFLACRAVAARAGRFLVLLNTDTGPAVWPGSTVIEEGGNRAGPS